MSGSERRAGLYRSDLPLPRVAEGKVREIYDAGDGTLLMVASDRLSAFDVVLPQPVPRKGEVLTMVTAWWLERLEARPGVEHHLVAVRPDEIVERVPALAPVDQACWAGRSMLVRRTEPVPVECVVRAYLAGSAWREYRDAGTLAGVPLPAGLREADRLPSLLFSPATKAARGEHDENISFREVEERVGAEEADRLRSLSLELFREAARIAEERGILLADTKFEFGRDPSGRLLLIDEVLTPDSSRFWPREAYEPGGPQRSLDKEPIRSYLASLPDWDGTAPAPELPAEVVEATTARYLEAFRRLTGSELDRFEPPSFRTRPSPVP